MKKLPDYQRKFKFMHARRENQENNKRMKRQKTLDSICG